MFFAKSGKGGRQVKENSLVQLFVRNLVMAVAWGIIVLVVFLIVSVGVKQQIKEGIQFATKMGIYETSSLALSYPVFTRIKQNIKEGAEFAAKAAKNELKDLLNDPAVKEDLKEIFEYSAERHKD